MPHNLNVDQAAKLNRMFPKGYKLVVVQEYRKKQAQSKKKSKITYIVPPENSIAKTKKSGRRNKYNVSYDQEEAFEPKHSIKAVYYDAERQNNEFYKKSKP